MKGNSYEILKKLLLSIKEFSTQDNNLNLPKIQKDGFNATDTLISLLLQDETLKKLFFSKQGEVLVYNRDKFIDFISNKNFLANSYTNFSNKIGLAVENRFLKQNSEVVLNFPFKDCVLEGGQTKDDKKQNELFFNETLAADEIDKLLSPKVLSNAKRYTQDGISKKVEFKRDENGLIKDNLIIKGNNLLALHTLKSNFAGKVKLIYIDLPYNTGNDSFNYNDNFNHSTWLTFMKNRLEVARALLSDDGVIFVQCDDNEQAYLKVLMDEVFGRDNFVSNVVWKGRGGRQDTKHIAQIHETIICFSKIIDNLELNDKVVKDISKYPYFDELKNKNYKTQLVRKWGSNSKREDRPNLFYKVEFQSDIIYPILPNGNDGCWRWSRNRLQNAIDNNLIISQEKNKKIELYEKIYQGNGTKKVVNNSVLEDTFSGEGAKHILSIFKENVFEYTKPEGLLKIIIEMSTKKGDLVLDYHLGSGTTCAVAHKMGRQYIGIEQMDYIEDIAVKRMQKVIGKTVKKDGELLESVDFDNGGISKSVEWQGGGEFIYLELKQNTAEIINKITNAKTTDELLAIKNSIKDYTFVDYRINLEFLKDNSDNEFKDFADLHLEGQQKILISIFDKNQMFVNYSERDDSLFEVTDEEKAISKDFYKNTHTKL